MSTKIESTPTTLEAGDPHVEKRQFLEAYWRSLNTGDFDTFAALVDENCVVHYPGNHLLSGDHRGKAAVDALYRKLYAIGIANGTFVGRFHDGVFSDDHACALIMYTLELGAGQRLTGEAIGVFHVDHGQMVEYWLLERDQRMINDIFALSGKAVLAGGGTGALVISALLHPGAVIRTIRRVIRQRRGTTSKML